MRAHWLLICCSVLLACQRPQAHSAVFNRLFLPEKGGVFRGIALGEDIARVKRVEIGHPRHEDRLGLAYRYALPQAEMRLEYYADNLRNDAPTNRLTSIVAHIQPKNAAAGAKLYTEIVQYLRQEYGTESKETYGNGVMWQATERGVLVSLRHAEAYEDIALNFVALL